MTDNDGKWNDARDRIVGTEQHAVGPDGVDRGGFLKCMAWAGAGLVWSFVGGIPVSRAFGSTKRELQNVLGIIRANFVAQKHDLAVVDSSLSGAPIEAHESRLLL